MDMNLEGGSRWAPLQAWLEETHNERLHQFSFSCFVLYYSRCDYKSQGKWSILFQLIKPWCSMKNSDLQYIGGLSFTEIPDLTVAPAARLTRRTTQEYQAVILLSCSFSMKTGLKRRRATAGYSCLPPSDCITAAKHTLTCFQYMYSSSFNCPCIYFSFIPTNVFIFGYTSWN